MSGHPERVAFSFVGPGKGPFSSMPGKGGREPVMAEAEDGKNGQQGQQGQADPPEPTDWQAKYEAMKSHSREWERKAFDYQSECHCSKTPGWQSVAGNEFDYQSECHCSKTVCWCC